MNCMKCGREIADDQVFCPKCMELMAQHPVKPDVVIRLPQRQETVIRKTAPRKKVLTKDAQIARLKRRTRWLAVINCLLFAACLLILSLCIDYIRQLDVRNLPGQNYSTIETLD